MKRSRETETELRRPGPAVSGEERSLGWQPRLASGRSSANHRPGSGRHRPIGAGESLRPLGVISRVLNKHWHWPGKCGLYLPLIGQSGLYLSSDGLMSACRPQVWSEAGQETILRCSGRSWSISHSAFRGNYSAPIIPNLKNTGRILNARQF